MFGRAGHKVITATIEAGSTEPSSAINVSSWNHVALEVQTFSNGITTSTANVYVKVASTSDGTFRRVQDEGAYSAGVSIADWEVPSSSGNYNVICRPAARYNFIKPEVSNTATASFDIYVHVHN